jgi:hypothetical protein
LITDARGRAGENKIGSSLISPDRGGGFAVALPSTTKVAIIMESSLTRAEPPWP